MIPHIIHQTWIDSTLPNHMSILSETWKAKHPGWQYVFWTDQMNRDFIKEYHSDFLRIYDGYPHNIQRVDAVRYFILYRMGGVFIDLDFECLCNIEPLLKDQECVFGLEPEEHCQRFKKQKIICNAFMACNPKNPFFKTICTHLKNNEDLRGSNIPEWLHVLESTGPFKLTKIFSNYDSKHAIKLLAADTIYPLSVQETRELLGEKGIMNEHMQDKIDNAYAVHYFLGSWWE
ncbi:MAG: glycoside transferase family 32 [Sphingobacteriales bacterium]|nr:glycoside transferase family 32 [Sphingobacteriales bacterium]